jgi:mevalonate pyrophosphate decarboxylase
MNIRSIIIIKQIQNMNLMLNMKDINRILAKTTKNTVSHPAVLLNSFKCCAPVVFV